MFELEKTQQAVFNLYALFYAMSDSAENLDESSIARHREIVTTFGQMGEEQLKVIQDNIEETGNKSLSTAEMISFLINDESVPDEISDALSDAVTNIFNFLPAECTAQKIDHTPEYIESVLSDHDYAKEENGDE